MKLNKKKKFDTKKLEKIIKNKNTYYNFFLFIIGMALSAISVSVFYSPNEVVTTGSTGLAIILNKYLNIDLSLLVLCLSSMLLVLSFLVFGINYGSKHILGTLLFPVFLKSATLINRVVNFEGVSLFLLIVIGGVLAGIGFGLVKRSNYSLGGFYVLYDIINKNFKISIGKASLICNSIIIILSIFTFGIDKCIYAIIGLYMTSYFGDKIMLGISSNKAFYIITRKPSEVKEYALEKGLNIEQPLKVRNNPEFVEKLKNINPDVICVVAYGKIIPKEILDIPRLGCINVHGSLLPKYRGAAPIQWAVLNGDKETGVIS